MIALIRTGENMFQDIAPHKLDNQFNPRKVTDSDYVVVYDEDKALFSEKEKGIAMPKFGEISHELSSVDDELIYLFSVDETAFYLSIKKLEIEGYEYRGSREFQRIEQPWLAFAGATAYHLAKWYESCLYCGKCSAPMERKENERAVYCPVCGYSEYPRIAPVVIVGITDGDKLLLTKYSSAEYKKHALVAGFIEIGETVEEGIKREVLEEVGIKVKNIRYYRSQPWAFSQSVLMGFFADLDGSSKVSLDDEELSEAEWFSREDIPMEDSTMSLTWDMIEHFKQGNF